MAAVYVAEDTRDRREVALKLLQPHLARAPEAVRRFLCEGAIAGMIDHENVVRIFDHGGGADGSCFIAMELLEGEGLFERLRRAGALPPAEVVAILVQVCNGLEAAHRQGVVHRDLKPENIFLHGARAARPVVKILDFGVAAGAHGEGGDTGLVVGTPEYLSPEQAFGKAADARSDVYSVGVMAWRMLVGRPPFTAESADAVIKMQARDAGSLHHPGATRPRRSPGPRRRRGPRLRQGSRRTAALGVGARPGAGPGDGWSRVPAHPHAPPGLPGAGPGRRARRPRPSRTGPRRRMARPAPCASSRSVAFVLALAVAGAAALLHARPPPPAGTEQTAPAR